MVAFFFQICQILKKNATNVLCTYELKMRATDAVKEAQFACVRQVANLIWLDLTFRIVIGQC